MSANTSITFRPSDQALAIINKYRARDGDTKTGVIERALREFDRQEEARNPSKKNPKKSPVRS